MAGRLASNGTIVTTRRPTCSRCSTTAARARRPPVDGSSWAGGALGVRWRRRRGAGRWRVDAASTGTSWSAGGATVRRCYGATGPRRWTRRSAARAGGRPRRRRATGRPVLASARSASPAASEAAVDAEPAQRLGLPAPRSVPDEGQRSCARSPRPTMRSASARPATWLSTTPSPTYPPALRHARSLGRAARTGAKSRVTPSGPPQRWVMAPPGTSPKQLAERGGAAWRTPSARGRSRGSIREPKWYGAPRPPKTSRSSAVRCP